MENSLTWHTLYFLRLASSSGWLQIATNSEDTSKSNHKKLPIMINKKKLSIKKVHFWTIVTIIAKICNKDKL